jgi:hypothetical protein
MMRDVEALFQRQLGSWPALARGVEGLRRARTRSVRINWFEVLVRHIPHRIGSTTAAVDTASVKQRPCFLCPENLDPEEEGIAFDDELRIYCNPFPIVDRHLTIVHREHIPQRIAGRSGNLLDLAAALGGCFVIYNGPECGASAPDHLHFQAGSRSLFPIEADLTGVRGPAVREYQRHVLVFRGHSRAGLIDRLDRTIALLSSVSGRSPEPMINIAAFHDAGVWTVYIFPRGKHRPGVFHTGELTVSPAAIDLCGIFVTPVEKDFERISGADIAAIFREVTLPGDQFAAVAAGVEGAG